MNQEHAAAVNKLAKGLYPAITPDQLSVLREHLMPHESARALAVVRTHAANHEFFSLPQLIEALKADAAAAQARRGAVQNERVIDFIRRTESSSHGCDDPTSILVHFDQCWGAVKSSGAPHAGQQEIRQMIFGHCLMACREAGIGEDRANAIAREAVELQTGEKIKVAS